MAQLPQKLYGDGHDGAKTVSGTETLNVYKGCTGTASNTYFTVTAGDEASFSAGDLVMLHKSRGNTTTTCGTWELVTVASTSSGQVNTTKALANSYNDSGADQSQAVLIPQYTTFSCPSSQTLTATSWGGNVGGIVAICASTSIEVAGTVSISGGDGANGASGLGSTVGGFSGGNGRYGYQGYGYTGEGTVGDHTVSATNGSGGGAGIPHDSDDNAGGGGGGNGTAGSAGTVKDNATGGAGGLTSGNAALTVMTFGGGGSGSINSYSQGSCSGAGSGGGIVFLISKSVDLSSATIVRSNGGNGDNTGVPQVNGAGGAGGSILIKGETVDIGTNKITATGGTGGTAASGGNGGNGGVGRIRVEYGLSITGSTSTPSASTAENTDLIESGGGGQFLTNFI